MGRGHGCVVDVVLVGVGWKLGMGMSSLLQYGAGEKDKIYSTERHAWNFVLLGARPLDLKRGNFFEGTKATCQGIKARSEKTWF